MIEDKDNLEIEKMKQEIEMMRLQNERLRLENEQRALGTDTKNIDNSSTDGGTNSFCILVFVLALFGIVAPINVILSICALNSRKSNEKGLGLGLTALFLSIIECFVLLVLLTNM